MFARSSPHGSRGPAGLFRCPLPKRFNFGPDSLPRGTFGVAPRPSRPADAPRRFPLLAPRGKMRAASHARAEARSRRIEPRASPSGRIGCALFVIGRGRPRDRAEASKELLDRGIIDHKIYEWSDELRKHATRTQFTRLDAEDIFDFARTICEYIFVPSDSRDSEERTAENRKNAKFKETKTKKT